MTPRSRASAGSENKAVLIITYVFPPAAYVGTYRTLKHCKYLGEAGWTPMVLTIDPKAVEYQDRALCDEVPADVVVHRTADVDPAKWLARARRRPPGTAAAATTGGARQRPPALSRAWTKLKRAILKVLTESPDSHVFWVPLAILRGAWILMTRNIDVVYCSSPPHSSHLAAYVLARLFGRPYVLDLRDPWVASSGSLPNVESAARRAIIRRAAKVISISPGERDELRAEFPELPQGKFACITNGYDPTDFARTRPAPRRSPHFTLTHAGTAYSGAAAEFFEGLRRLADRDPSIEGRLRVQLLGDVAAEYMDCVDALRRRSVIVALGSQPHAVAIRAMLESDVLVILLGGDRFLASEIPAKVFEYLRAGKPILAITREGDAARILRQSGLGIVIAPGSPGAVADALQDLLRAFEAGTVKRPADTAFISTFERPALARQLAAIFDEVSCAVAPAIRARAAAPIDEAAPR